MEVNGLVIAASEKFSMDHCVGFLLLLYNSDMNVHFFILVCDKILVLWKNILVNSFYKFSDLKIGVLQTSSGGKTFLLKTTEAFTFSSIDSCQIKKFHIVEKLKSSVSSPEIELFLQISKPLLSNLVSYQGVVTKLINIEIGVYELDYKVLLYTTFNISCRKFNAGSKITISNAHLIQNYKCDPVLVCCGSSCVKYTNIDDESHLTPNDPYFANFYIQYGLNVFDLLWFERLLCKLKKKLVSLIADEETVFRQNSIFVKSTLEYFICTEKEPSSKKLSLAEEFLSNPHRCLPFLESRLPDICCVPYLSEILDDVIGNAYWLEAGARWEFCVGRQDDSVIIGILYTSDDGSFYIADRTLKLPIIFSEDCDDCCHDQNIAQEFKNFNFAFVVAIQEYDVLIENVLSKNGSWRSIQYIRTSFCRLYSLLPLYKLTSDDIFTSQNPLSKTKDTKSDQIICDLHRKSQENGNHFLVLSKIWTLQNRVPCFSRFLVMFLPEHSQNNSVSISENKSILEDSFNLEDDIEFANLVSELSLLQIQDEIKIGYLCFETSIQNNIILPGHIYSITCKDSGSKFKPTFEDRTQGIFTWTITPDMEVVHDLLCNGDHFNEDYEDAEHHGIKEILLKRCMNQNWIVSCILQDKMYEDVENGQWRNKSNATLCMVVRDEKSEESTLKVYVPYFAGSVFGLLPGASLRLFGFLCFTSQSGNLFLKASTMFGVSTKTFAGRRRLANGDHSYFQSGNTFMSSLQSLCFVVKIISAEIFLACSKCARPFSKRCTCYSQQKMKIKVNALIDDGKQVLSADCYDATAKKILKIEPSEWQSLVSYVQMSQQSLKFSDKTSKSKSSLLPIMNQVFSAYCSSKATSRKLMIEYLYVPKPYSNQSCVPLVWCKSAADVDYRKVMNRHYMNFIDNVTQSSLKKKI